MIACATLSEPKYVSSVLGYLKTVGGELEKQLLKQDSTSASTRRLRSLEGRLLTYAIAGGAALAASPAQAAIIHYGGAPQSTNGGTLDLDLNNDLVVDFTFNADSDNSAASADMNPTVSFPVGGVTNPLTAGTMVDVNSSYGTSAYKIAKSLVDSNGVVTNNGGNYTIDTDQYMGLQFQIGGSTHYGWALINPVSSSYTDQGVGYGKVDIALKDFAYESTADTGIEAGATSSVPEPSSLALFALGAAGIAALRRRRKAA